MRNPLIECVPNFSVGTDHVVIEKICDEIRQVADVKLLHVDPGTATNRTVVTFAGEPQAVCEAAFLAVKKAQELIDMRCHQGEHPRMGATDVLPLIPISNITLEETARLADTLGQRIATELEIPIYLYEAAAKKEERKNLAVCREGEYEALQKRIGIGETAPDYGPTVFTEKVARSGATAVGARDFLIAVNFNLNTTSTRRANAIAFDVREKGRKKREDDSLTGKVCKDEQGETIWTPGTLKGTKAIGWYIEEYGRAQVSMNITNIKQTPLHVAFEEVRKKAEARGVRVTGAEIVGLIPKNVLIEAGHFYLKQQQRSAGISEEEIIRVAEQSMGLDELHTWNAQERVIEYLLMDPKEEQLIDLSLKKFLQVTASESPAPGGGSVSAYMGALGVGLGTMVANLSSHKRGWDERWEVFSNHAIAGQFLQSNLLHLVDEDTKAFNQVMECFKMPKDGDDNRKAYHLAMEKANLYAAEVPLQTMKYCVEAIPLMKSMLELGNQNSRSDVLVGIIALYAACEGAYQNVCINTDSIHDLNAVEKILDEARSLRHKIKEFVRANYK